jgi:hypothetical protein
VPFVNVTTADWDSIPDQVWIAVDGTAGTVTVGPDAETLPDHR